MRFVPLLINQLRYDPEKFLRQRVLIGPTRGNFQLLVDIRRDRPRAQVVAPEANATNMGAFWDSVHLTQQLIRREGWRICVKTQVGVLYDHCRSKYSVQLRAGADGLTNSTSWIYLAEDITNAPFLRGGELVITTGLFTKAGDDLLDFVQALAVRDCSAILVNLGPYLTLEDLTPQVTSFCERNRLPLFTMPWEVRLVDITRDLTMVLLRESQRLNGLSSVFEAALYQSPASDRILRGLTQFGFNAQGPYRVAVIHNLGIPERISSALNRFPLTYHLFAHDNLHVLVYHVREDGILDDQLLELLCYYDGISVGLSATSHDLADLGNAYKRALFALAVAELWQRPYVGFDELGMLQLLFCVSDQQLLEDLHATYLGPLEDYDREHDANLVHTLKVYLLTDCSLVETSVQLPAHRNTVVYRVRRIKEILKVDLSQATVKFNLILALYIREYLSM